MLIQPGAANGPCELPGSRSPLVKLVCETFAARLVAYSLFLASTIVISRALGPEGRGLYAIVVTVTALGVQFCNFGLHAANINVVARHPDALPAVVGNSLMISLGFGGCVVVACLLLFALVPAIAPIAPGAMLELALIGIPIGLAYLLLQSALLGRGDMLGYNLAEIGSKALLAALISVLLVRRTTEPVPFIAATVASTVAPTAFIGWRLRLAGTGRPRLSASLFAANLGYSLRVYLSCVLGFLVQKAGLFFVQSAHAGDAVGWYAASCTLSDALGLLPGVVSTVLFPRLSAMTDHEQRWRTSLRVTLVTTAGMAVVASVAAIAAPVVVRMLFGKAFMPCLPAFYWLLPGAILLAAESVMANSLSSVGQPASMVFAWLASAAVAALLNALLVPRIGGIGAAIAYDVAMLVMLLAVIVLARNAGSDARRQGASR